MTQLANKRRNTLKHPDQRVGVFIDVQNMYYSAKNLFGAKVNFGNIVKEATAGRKLIRAIAYVVSTESKEEQPFFDALYNLGIETKDKPLQIFLGGEKKADWDVGLAVDARLEKPTCLCAGAGLPTRRRQPQSPRQTQTLWRWRA